MKLYISLLLAGIILLMTGCSQSASLIDDRIESAHVALIRGDYAKAQKICDGVAEETDDLTVSQLGRLSILYMKLTEGDLDESDDLDKAALCYRAAWELDADSARMFYSDCQVDDMSYVMMLSAIVKNIDDPMDIPAELPDSLIFDSIPQP